MLRARPQFPRPQFPIGAIAARIVRMTSSWAMSAVLLVACNTEGAKPDPVTSPAASPARVERDSSGKVFKCMIDKPTGRHACEPTAYGCQREGCEERAEAWCFPSIAQPA